MVADAASMNAIPDSLPLDVASMHFVNPLTAMGLLEKVQEKRAAAFIQTGAASQLGRMLIKMAKNAGIPCINIVRRLE